MAFQAYAHVGAQGIFALGRFYNANSHVQPVPPRSRGASATHYVRRSCGDEITAPSAVSGMAMAQRKPAGVKDRVVLARKA